MLYLKLKKITTAAYKMKIKMSQHKCVENSIYESDIYKTHIPSLADTSTAAIFRDFSCILM
jgi:hypothetical protein